MRNKETKVGETQTDRQTDSRQETIVQATETETYRQRQRQRDRYRERRRQRETD